MSDAPAHCTVVIAAPQFLEAVCRLAGGEGDVLRFADHDALNAFEAIATRRPRLVTLERLFAITSRGAALINRIKSDPALNDAEIRIVSHDGSYSRVSHRRATASAAANPSTTPAVATAAPAEAPAAALDYRGTRRAQRFKLAEGTEGQVDGTAATIVDLSIVGAQIVATSALRPQQRIRIALADDAGVVRFNASVVWALFEMPKATPVYRAGIEFSDADASAVEAFCRRHQS